MNGRRDILVPHVNPQTGMSALPRPVGCPDFIGIIPHVDYIPISDMEA